MLKLDYLLKYSVIQASKQPIIMYLVMDVNNEIRIVKYSL